MPPHPLSCLLPSRLRSRLLFLLNFGHPLPLSIMRGRGPYLSRRWSLEFSVEGRGDRQPRTSWGGAARRARRPRLASSRPSDGGAGTSPERGFGARGRGPLPRMCSRDLAACCSWTLRADGLRRVKARARHSCRRTLVLPPGRCMQTDPGPVPLDACSALPAGRRQARALLGSRLHRSWAVAGLVVPGAMWSPRSMAGECGWGVGPGR